eukprot:15325844-Ditylum_brightwellii.AAC.2
MISDTSLLGALPACLWTDQRNANMFNFASALDHFKCMLMNYDLFCSTYLQYIQLIFDAGCNIKCHGIGSVIVQKRSFESLYGDGGPVIKGNQTMNFNCYVCVVVDSRKSVNCLVGVNHVYQSAKEYSDAMSQATMVPIPRCYNKVFDLFFRWIVESDEKPLGDIDAYWSAAECQEMNNKPSGTISHYHSILYVKRGKQDVS